MSIKHWDNYFHNFQPYKIDIGKWSPAEKCFFTLIGEVKGKHILELGCGNGVIAITLAKMGGNVFAIDNSETAIKNISKLAVFNEVCSNVDVKLMDVTELGTLCEKFDLVVGRFILHHIKPFEKYSHVLYNLLKENGRGVFFENSANNPLLTFAREHLVGKGYGIKKLGDEEEYPFRKEEIQMLVKKFSVCNVYYPEFVFFYMLAPYIFKENLVACKIFYSLDKTLYYLLPFLRQYSYLQVIELKK